MMFWLRLALRNALRNRRRSALTALTVILGTALLTVALSWVNGVLGGFAEQYAAHSGHIRVVNEAFARREEMMPLYENIADATPVIEAVASVAGVVDVQPRITTAVAITATEEIGDHFALVVGASDEYYYRRHLNAPAHVVAGTWLTGEDRQVVVGRKLASDVGISVGDEVVLFGQTQYGSMSPVNARVVGVLAMDHLVDRCAYISLEEARWLTDMPGGALELMVYGETMDTKVLSTVVAAMKRLDETEGLDISAWNEREPWASMTGVFEGMKRFIQFLLLFVAALAIFNTMTMSVLERSAEIGVLRAMGLSGSVAVLLFMVEAASIGLVGGVLGAGLGSLGGLYLEIVGVTLVEEVVEKFATMPMKSTVYADLTPEIVVTAVLFGVLIAAVGAILPALRAATIQPVTAMRARR